MILNKGILFHEAGTQGMTRALYSALETSQSLAAGAKRQLVIKTSFGSFGCLRLPLPIA
jgi:hypothetical protein